MSREEHTGRFVAALRAGRAGFGVTLGLAIAFWFPALLGKVMLHGDAGLIGLPLLSLHARALASEASLSWVVGIAGGHPLFAEGQGGFANPLNVAAVLAFDPAYASGFVHFASVVVGAAGVYALCRALAIGRWAATFASIAVAFSGTWIASQHNLPISASLAWAPWLIVAVERWLAQPSLLRALGIALAAALLVLGGYPQVAHGAALYVLAAFVPRLLSREERGALGSRWRTLLPTGLLAAALAVGLAAIQLLPLLELVGESHRNRGIALIFDELPAWMYLRGALFFYLGGERSGQNVFSLGCIAVLLLAGLVLFVRTPPRVLGHALAAALLCNLGMAFASPLFAFVYTHRLVPGLHSFRSTHLYLALAVIGVAVTAAHVLDALARDGAARLWRPLQRRTTLTAGALAIYAAGLITIALVHRAAVYSAVGLVSGALMGACCLALAPTRLRGFLPLAAVVVLAGDVLALRVRAFDFHDRELLAQPKAIRTVVHDPRLSEYRVMSMTNSGAMTFLAPDDPDVASEYRRALTSFSSLTGLVWGVPSIEGPLALHSARWTLARKVMQDEATGVLAGAPGTRLMDILGVRYLALGRRGVPPPATSLFSGDRRMRVAIYRNEAAKPRFQVYGDAAVVETAEQVLRGLQRSAGQRLFLEAPRAGARPHVPACIGCASGVLPAAPIEVRHASDTRYRLTVQVPRRAWLFVADANYPGWQATVNGSPQPVYSAQILGKAVALRQGRNEVLIEYEPRFLRAGALLSALTLLVVGSLAAVAYRRARREGGGSPLPG